jgi:flagellar hook-length control protein FliK
MQGAAGAAGKRKVLGRLAAGAAPANDAVSAAGAQTTGPAGAKSQSVSLAQGAPFQPQVVERKDAGEQAREGSRHMEAGLDGVPAALAQWASDAAAGVRGAARGVDSGTSVSGAGGAAEVSQERPAGLAGDVGTEFVDPAMAGTEDAVAEQVAYWVHQNIQNAKLTVKHDGQPVEVSVSLTGNEAHVSFGSDQAQTRDLIDGSVAQLRDMLRQEGLVLSGVTVGESGGRQGDEGAGAGGQKNPQRQTGVVVPAAVATRAAGRVNVLGDRAVDIFV